jgi:hypothetical protein
MIDYVDAIMDYENGALGLEGTIRLFSHLVASGAAWRLQGHYGRTASGLIDAGILAPDGAILQRRWEDA